MLRVREVAQRLNLSESTVYGLVESGELPHHRFRGAIRVSEEQLAAYLDLTKQERRESAPRIRKPRRPQLKHIRLT